MAVLLLQSPAVVILVGERAGIVLSQNAGQIGVVLDEHGDGLVESVEVGEDEGEHGPSRERVAVIGTAERGESVDDLSEERLRESGPVGLDVDLGHRVASRERDLGARTEASVDLGDHAIDVLLGLVVLAGEEQHSAHEFVDAQGAWVGWAEGGGAQREGAGDVRLGLLVLAEGEIGLADGGADAGFDDGSGLDGGIDRAGGLIDDLPNGDVLAQLHGVG